MTVELRPLGVSCNLACTYCYQEPVRQANAKPIKYNIDSMIEEALSTGQDFVLFGGEALLVPKKDLEKIWKKGYELYGRNGLQTNGTLIDDDHIQLFKKYNVHVGVSIDGPNELNNLRQVKNSSGEDATLEFTSRIINNLKKLTENEIDCSIIITLHKLNGTEDKLERLINFIKWLGETGIKSGNIHLLEVDKTMPEQEKYVLSQKENMAAFLRLAEFFKDSELFYKPFSELKNALLGDDLNITCYLKRCDPLNTQAVYGIEGSGSISNCGRSNKEGVEWYKANDTKLERYINLFYTPQEHDGCKGCRFFLLCGGSCPGEGIDYDCRNKTIHCSTQKAILGYYEKELIKDGLTPFTKRKDFKEIEGIIIEGMMNGMNIAISEAIRIHYYRKLENKMFVLPVLKEEVNHDDRIKT